MTKFTDLFSKPKTPGPTVRTAAELGTALAALQDSLPTLEAKVAEAALQASDDLAGADAALADAEAALTSANARIKALTGALALAQRREAADLQAKRYAVTATQGGSVAKLLERSEKKAEELSAHLAAAVKSYHEVLDLRSRAALAFPGGNPPDYFLLTAPQLLRKIQNELWRLGGKNFKGGQAHYFGEAPSFPGGKPEKLNADPSEITPLVNVLADADDAAVAKMAKDLEALKPAGVV